MLRMSPALQADAAREGRIPPRSVFFILVVAHCGGLLTPLGDPPLFLGFLKGIALEWTPRRWKP